MKKSELENLLKDFAEETGIKMKLVDDSCYGHITYGVVYERPESATEQLKRGTPEQYGIYANHGWFKDARNLTPQELYDKVSRIRNVYWQVEKSLKQMEEVAKVGKKALRLMRKKILFSLAYRGYVG